MIWTYNFSHRKEFPELTIFFPTYHEHPTVTIDHQPFLERSKKNASCLLNCKILIVDYWSESSAKNTLFYQRLHQTNTTESSQHVTIACGEGVEKGKEVAKIKAIPCTNLFLL